MRHMMMMTMWMMMIMTLKKDAAWRHFAGLMCQIECQLAIWTHTKVKCHVYHKPIKGAFGPKVLVKDLKIEGE